LGKNFSSSYYAATAFLVHRDETAVTTELPPPVRNDFSTFQEHCRGHGMLHSKQPYKAQPRWRAKAAEKDRDYESSSPKLFVNDKKTSRAKIACKG
jgi:hypothetical protein